MTDGYAEVGAGTGGARGLNSTGGEGAPVSSRSHYHLSRQELVRGVANRFVFSQAYIYLYLTMAILSLTTVVLSLLSECPTLPFYILEIIVNTTMILEVAIRFTAFGKQFWKSPFNWLDLGVTMFCVITLLVIFLSGCSAKSEEVFDTFLLVIRNAIQFSRLALMLRRSGKNIFSTIPPINLEDAAYDTTGFMLDMDLDDEEALLDSRRAEGGDMGARGRRDDQFESSDDEDMGRP